MDRLRKNAGVDMLQEKCCGRCKNNKHCQQRHTISAADIIGFLFFHSGSASLERKYSGSWKGTPLLYTKQEKKKSPE